MKNSLYIILLSIAFSQTNGIHSSTDYFLNDSNLSTTNRIDEFQNNDFSKLFAGAHGNFYLGYIGKDFTRIHLVFIDVSAMPGKNHVILIDGKSNVEGNIAGFSGQLEITEIRLYKEMHYGIDDELKDADMKFQGVLLGTYHLKEKSDQQHSGQFKGKFISAFYIDKNNIVQYNDIELYSDRWCNNQFYGTWQSYEDSNIKTCNWGDGRIPFDNGLDVVVGEFYPAERYHENGWEIFKDLFSKDKEVRENAEERYTKKWWK
jgi:hypothetical protein